LVVVHGLHLLATAASHTTAAKVADRQGWRLVLM
jgi:hypothetical protein